MTDRSEESAPSPARSVAVLAVSPLPCDLLRLRVIRSPRNWKLHEASDCGEALALLCGQNFPVLLCERHQPDGSWEDLLAAMAGLPTPPKKSMARAAQWHAAADAVVPACRAAGGSI